MRKKVLIAILILALLGAGAYYYINLVFLPVQLKEIVATKARDYLQREVRAGKIFFRPVKGVVIQDLLIFEKDSRDQVFLRVEEISFNVLLTSFFKNRSIIIPSVTLEKPRVSLVKNAPGQWNVSDLLGRHRQGQAGGPFSFFIGGLVIRGGSVQVTDKTNPVPVEETWSDVALKARISLKQTIDFEAEAQDPRAGSLIKTKGRYVLAAKDTQIEAAVKNIDVYKYITLFEIPINGELREGFISGAVIKLQTADRHLHDLSGKMSLKADLSLDSGRRFKGILQTDGLEVRNRSGRVTVQADDFSLNEASLLISGYHLNQGSCAARGFKLTVGRDEFLFQGVLELSQVDLAWPKDNRFQGNAVLNDLFCHKKDGQFRLKGDLASDRLAWSQGNQIDLSGPLTVKSILVHQEEEIWKVSGEVESPALQLRVADQFSFSGTIQTTPATLKFQDDRLSVKSSFDIKDGEIILKKENKLYGTFRVQDLVYNRAGGKTDLKTRVDSDQVRISLAGNKTFSGAPDLNLRLTHDPQAEQPLTYAGTLTLTGATLSGLPQVGRLDNIQGILNIRTEDLATEKITFETLGKTIALSGSLKDFRHPFLDIKAGAQDTDLKTLQPFWAGLMKDFPLDAEGAVDWQLGYKGPLSGFDQAKISLRADLKGATLTSARFPAPLPGKITDVNGLIRYANRELTWQDLEAKVRNQQVVLNGKFQNQKPQILETTLQADRIDLSARAAIDDNRIDLRNLAGTFLRSQIDLQGDITLRGPAGPALNFKGHGDVAIADLAKIHPALAQKIAELKMDGDLNIRLSFRGEPLDWPRAVMDIQAACPQLTVMGLRIDNTSLKVKNDAVTTGRMDARGDFYGGDITLNSTFDPASPTQPFTLTGRINNADLAQLKKDSNMKKKELYGTLDFAFDATGSLKAPQQLTGEGVLTVEEGYIWELSLLRGIWKVLMIPEFDRVVFTDALAHFDIKDQKVTTNDLYLTGTTADLKGHGWFGFDRKIDLTIIPKFRATEIVNSIQSKILPKFPSGLLAGTEGYLQIKISGTLDKPNYTVVTLPTKVLKNTTNAIFDGVKSIIDEIAP